MRRLLLLLVGIMCIGSLLYAGGEQEAGTLNADEWPGEPIIMTCPWGAGGIADLTIRAMSEYGEKYFDNPMIPVVRTGAGGAVAITEFTKHRPNAPQMIMASEGLFAITPLTNEIAYKWDDFIPVIGSAFSAFALVSNATSDITSMDELKAYGKNNTVTVAITGDNLLFVGAFFDKAGIKYKAVPYGGAAEQLAAVLAGDVDLGVTHPALAKEHAKAGKVSPLLVFDDEAWVDEFYNIPPVTDFGYDVVFPNLNFFLMPGGTDPEVIKTVYEKLSKIYQEPEFIEVAKKLNIVIKPATREEIEAHIDNATTKAKEYYNIVYQ